MGSESGRVGIYIDLHDVRTDGSRSSWQDVRKMAQEAERIGCDSVWLSDRLQVGDVGVWESTTMVAAVAAVTDRVTIGTLVTRSIYRNPALLAKVADSIDEISAGRFILGLGAGSNAGDQAQFGYPTDHRISRFEEALQITHALLRTGRVAYSGAYYRAEGAILQPRGPRPNGPPIAIAATGPRMMRLAARYADFWHCLVLPTTPESLQPHINAMEAACAAEQRDPGTLGRMAVLLLATTPEVPHPYGDAVSGAPDQVAERIQRFFDYGFDEVILYPSPDSSQAISALEPVIEALKN